MSHAIEAATMIGRALLLQRNGRPADAALLLRQAVAWAPDQAATHHHLALILQPVAEPALVERLIRRALCCAPAGAEAYGALAALLGDLGRSEEAAAAALTALLLRPDDADSYGRRGWFLKALGRLGAAEACYRRLPRFAPGSAAAWGHLGGIIRDPERADEALRSLRIATVLDPQLTAVYSNSGNALQGKGEIDAAIGCYRLALRLAPDHAASHSNLGVALLLTGAFDEGWPEYDWWRHCAPVSGDWRGNPATRWSGQDLAGRTLLLRAEQGLGDTLHFARYAALFAARGARVVLEVQPPLAALLRSVPGVAATVAAGTVPPPFDYHLPLMSAPALLGTRLATIPAEIPYVSADPQAAMRWRDRLSALPGLKVGLVWAGNPRLGDPSANLIDQRRSMALARLRPLLDLPGISFVSLQKGGPAAQLAELPAEIRPVDVMEEIGDFADTAALCANLDLVITVDTSVAHLAGALGKPVWILSRFDGCWRWLLDREDSPWYPTARLFRQRRPGDWDEVVTRVGAALAALAGSPETRPDAVAAMIGRSRALQQRGRPADAALVLRQAVALSPALDKAHHHLALILQPVAAPALVERLIGRAVRCAPAAPDSRANLALALCDQRRHDEAEVLARSAVVLDPAYGNGHNNLGRTFKERARPHEAVPCFRRAARLVPSAAMGWVNLGDALEETGRVEAALDCTRAALAADPASAAAWNNRGHMLQGRGDKSAIPALRRAIRLRPSYAAAHLNLGMSLLQQGALVEGWREYDWWRRLAPVPPGWQGAPETRWNGQDLRRKTLLIRGEQGLGDVLQFSRYATLFARIGARVILEVPPPLTRLLASVPGVAQTCAMGEAPPPHDYHLQMMSAPTIFSTGLDTIPDAIPYISADPERVRFWGERLSGLAGRKVGLVWGGNPRVNDPAANLVDGRRSIALARLAPLLDLPGISFVSLQKGGPAAQRADLPPESRPFDVMDEIEDFADTAALCTHLDLVITVDTSVAHLAGALGKPVWILSRFDGCWRWLLDREDSPWYPTARLFRQRSPGDWDEVVARVKEALSQAS
jgi:tetratricopeptide (TPR) repeat protein